MATDVKKILDNLFGFFDFRGKTMISVGAGGGQFIDYGRLANKVIAVDSDDDALLRLQDCLSDKEYKNKFSIIHADFLEIKEKADLVLFEFSLHEIDRPEQAIKHALSLADSVIIADHAIGSEWAELTGEKEKVERCSKAILGFDISKKSDFPAIQYFPDYQCLWEKVHGQGQQTIDFIEQYMDASNIEIPMEYQFVLLHRPNY